MNQDQVKNKLNKLAEVPDFSLIFSGKVSTKVDGLYKPESREIIIHNHNMKGDHDLMYTALHEFAHHVHCCTSGTPVSGRCHTSKFWAVFHDLLKKAEKKKIYSNPFKTDEDFINLTSEIRENYIKKNGELMKRLGSLLFKARDLCVKKHLSFDDYSDRELNMHRSIAKTVIKLNSYDISPEIGYENMKTVAAVANHEKRTEVEKEFLKHESPDLVKVMTKGGSLDPEDDPVERLEAEKHKIEKTISTLRKKLADVEKRIHEISI
jgi:hypothetical protein